LYVSKRVFLVLSADIQDYLAVSGAIYQLYPIPLSYQGEGEERKREAGAPLRKLLPL
jgi:hypothetical protein